MTRKLDHSRISLSFGILSALLCVLAVATSQATEYWWNAPSGGAGAWDTTTTKWSVDSTSTPSVIWNNATVGGDDATFEGGSAYTVTVDPGGITVHNITSNLSTARLTLSGSTLTLTGSNPTISVAAGNMSINGSIAGTSGLIKTGAGWLDIFGDNSGLSGPFDVQTGFVVPQTDTSFGTGPVNIASGAAIEWWGTGNPRTIANNVTIIGNGRGAGAIALYGGGSNMTFSNTITLAGDATIRKEGWGTGTLNANNIDGSAVNANLNYGLNGGTGVRGTISGAINLGTGTFSKYFGTGTLVLSGSTANTWSNLSIMEGYVQVGDGGANGNLPSAANIFLSYIAYDGGVNLYNGTLAFNTDNDITISGVISGTSATNWVAWSNSPGGLLITKVGTLTLSGSNSFTGPVTLNAGTLNLQNDNALGNSSLVSVSGGTATSKIVLGSPNTIGNSITLIGRSVSDPHIVSSGTNSITGDLKLIEGGNQYTVQSDSGRLTLNTITNNSALTSARTVNLQGAGDGEVTGAIGNGTSSSVLSVSKAGSGTWTLSGYNTYTGSTTINAGKLVLGPGASVGTSSLIDVKSGATLDVTAVIGGFDVGTGQTLSGGGTVEGDVTLSGNAQLIPGSLGTVGNLTFLNNLTFNGSAGNVVKFDLSETTTANNDLVSLTSSTGTLTLPSGANTATITINMLGSGLTTSNPYKLFTTNGTIVGNLSNVTLTGIGGTTRQTGSLSIAPSVQEIDLNVSGLPPVALIWKGNIDGNWDYSTTNWTWASGGSSDRYYDYDTVTFDNSSTTQTVTITNDAGPGSMTINSDLNYTFQGTGSIGGVNYIGLALTKSGTGKLILKNTGTNIYGGGTTINAGTLQVGDNTSGGGLGTGNVVNNSALIVYRTDDSTISGVLSGSGSLEKMGAGKLTLGNSNTAFTGATSISNGQVVMGSANALGPTDTSTAITITSSGSLDIGGNTLGARQVSVSGSGTDGSGAIVNTGAGNNNAFRFVTLTGNTTFGGSNRWDIRTDNPTTTPASLTGNGYNLTKTGSNTVYLVNLGSVGLGNININGGMLGLQGTTNVGTSIITASSTGVLGLWDPSSAITNSLTLSDTAGLYNGSGTNTYSGTITVSGSNSFNIGGGTLTVSSAIGGTGILVKTGATGIGNWMILTNTANSWSGGTQINGGTLQIGDGGNNGSLPDAVGTSIITSGTASSGELYIYSGRDMTLSNAMITGSGQLTKGGTGTLTLDRANSFNGPVLIVDGALRLRNADALGDISAYTPTVSISGGNATGRLEIDAGTTGGYTVTAQPTVTLSGRQPTLTPAPHVNNYGDNTFAGGFTFATGGSNYTLQSDSGTLTLNGIITDSLGTARYLNLTGVGKGVIVGGINFTSTTGSLSVVKAGTGIWTIAGSSSHNGITSINAGTLALGTNGYIGTSSLINVQSGATFDVTAVSGGFTLYSNQTLSGNGTVVGNVTDSSGSVLAAGSSIGTLTFDNDLTLAGGDVIDYEFGGGSGDLFDVTGTLTLNGGEGTETIINPIAISAPSSATTTYRVANGTTSLTGTGIKVVNNTRYVVSSSVTTGAAGKIDLTVSGSNASLIWNGTASPNDLWDLKTTNNWLNSGSADMFYASDAVSFTDSATVTAVNINTTVRPMSITVDASKNYTFGGTGRISGGTGLTKSGSGTLTISNSGLANNYTGTTTVNGGTLVLNVYNAIGDFSPLQINNGGTVRMGVANAMGENNVASTTIADGGTLDLNGNSVVNEQLYVKGAGVGGNGAIINTGGNATWSGSVRLLTLQGDTTVGGNISLGSQDTGRWEVGLRYDQGPAGAYMAGNGYTLTKTGSNNFWLVNLGYTNLGAVVVNQGELTIEVDNNTVGTVLGTSTSLAPITVNAGGQFGMWTLASQMAAGAVLNNPVTLNGGGIGGTQGDTQTPLTYASNIALNGGGIIYAADTDAGQEVTFSGAFNGTGDLTKAGSFVSRSQINYNLGTAIMTGTNSNTYDGATNVLSGRLILRKTGGATAIPGNLNIGNAVNGAAGLWDAVQLGGSDQIADSSIVTFTASDANNWAYLDMMGYNETVGGINDTTGYGIIQVQDTSTINTNSTLTVNNTVACSYNGLIRDKYAGAGTGVLALVKDGAGKLTLGVSNVTSGTPYSGGTTVKGGILSISDNTVLGSPSGKLTLNGGTLEATATLSLTTTGSSPVARPIEITSNGGGLMVDSGQILTLPGTYTLNGGLTVSGSGTLDLALTTAPTISASGSMSIVAGTIVTATVSVDPFTDGVNSAIHASVANNGQFTVSGGLKTIGGLTGSGTTTVTGTLSARLVHQGRVTINSGSKLIIRGTLSGPLSDGMDLSPITPVPEPSTWALLILAATGWFVYRLRRR